MARVIRFTTDKFDVSKESPNPINPIAGESILQWLRAKVGSTVSISEPDAEDWGWYSSIDWKGRSYLIGASMSVEDSDPEWIVQIDKHRSMKEKLMGREVMTADDECAAFIQRLLESEPAFRNVTVDPE